MAVIRSSAGRTLVFLVLTVLSACDQGELLSKRIADGTEASAPLSVQAVERDTLAQIHANPAVPQVPFGYLNTDWLALKASLKPGDKLIRLVYSANTANGEGVVRVSYAVVRGDRIVAEMVVGES